MEKAKLAKYFLHIHVLSQLCINQHHFSGFPDLIYANLNNLNKRPCYIILDLMLQIKKKEKVKKYWEVDIGEIFPKSLFLFHVF